MRKKRLLTSVILALVLTAVVTTAAFAHACTNANKLPGAGSIGVYNVATGTFDPGRNENMTNGGFVTFTDGGDLSVDIYLHELLPEGALAAGPDGDNMCDGVGVDLFLACIGAVSG